MTGDPTVFVTWYEPARRLSMPVARLVHHRAKSPGIYEFRYIRGAVEAAERGFQPFISFPFLHTIYRSRELFPLFANRVMPRTRPDYPEYIQALGLDSANADPMAILARSGGKRETDCIEVVPSPEPDERGIRTTHFLLRGARKVAGAEDRIAQLKPGERLFLMLDVQNETTPEAVALRTSDKHLLGYVPDFLVAEAARLIEVPMNVLVEQVNLPPAPLHHRLLCRIEARWPAEIVPFQGERFQPLEAQDATVMQAGQAP